MRYLLIILFLFLYLVAQAQTYIKGNVFNEQNQPLQGVSISDSKHLIIATSNNLGYFEAKATKIDSIYFTLTGFCSKSIFVGVKPDSLYKVILSENIIISQDVIVGSKAREKYVRSLQTGLFEIKTDSFKNLPSIAGEADPMNLLKLTPGVSKSELGMGLNVRGSSTDQNMFIIDGAVIYNPTHLAGFLSTFNSFSIEKVTLIKSGIPAWYGGRLSSVTEVESYKNIPDKMHISGNMGILLTGFSLKTPAFNNKIGIFIATRKSYIDYTIKPLSRIIFKQKRSLFSQTDYGFYDINVGITIAPTENDRIYLNSYLGNDDFVLYKSSFDLDNNMSWGNKCASMRWMHHFSNSHLMKTSSSYSFNSFHLFLGQNDFLFDLNSSITDYDIVHEHTFYSQKNTFKIGLQALKQSVVPNQSKASLSSLNANFGTPNGFNTATFSIYAQSDYSLNAKIAISAGLRYNRYYHFGPYQSFIRGNGQEITDTVFFKASNVVKNYNNFEPRLSLRYLINENNSLKISVSKNVQYIQQVSVSAVSLPTDFWMPSSTVLKPQNGTQFTLGYYNTVYKQYEGSIEVFYKNMQNLPEFKQDFLSSVTKATMEENLITGKGRAYGFELLVQRKIGSVTGWLSYTLSRTERIFAEINNGKAFLAKYDRTHDISIVAQYFINNKWSTSAIFVYTTGNAVTLPTGRYMVAGNILNQYTDYNSFRMPAYHRLDISITRTFQKRGNWEQKLNFSICNVYSRLNPYYMYFAVSGNMDRYQLKVTPKMVSIFPMVPSIAYEFKF